MDLVLVGAFTLVFMGLCLGVFAWRISRQRVFTRGLRGTALVVGVRPTTMFQRKSVIEAPTVAVTVATAQIPGGVETMQKLPAGVYFVGEIVDVIQDRRNPYRLYVNRPDLEPSVMKVYGPLVVAVMAPLILLLAATQPHA
jgi:hypothetical protein